MSDTIKILRGNRADLPTLKQGEPAICLDTGDFFVGGNGKNLRIPNAGSVKEGTITFVYVNANATGFEDGSVNHPYHTPSELLKCLKMSVCTVHLLSDITLNLDNVYFTLANSEFKITANHIRCSNIFMNGCNIVCTNVENSEVSLGNNANLTITGNIYESNIYIWGNASMQQSNGKKVLCSNIYHNSKGAVKICNPYSCSIETNESITIAGFVSNCIITSHKHIECEPENGNNTWYGGILYLIDNNDDEFPAELYGTTVICVRDTTTKFKGNCTVYSEHPVIVSPGKQNFKKYEPSVVSADLIDTWGTQVEVISPDNYE